MDATNIELRAVSALSYCRAVAFLLALSGIIAESGKAEDWQPLFRGDDAAEYFIDVDSFSSENDLIRYRVKAVYSEPRWDVTNRLFSTAIAELQGNCLTGKRATRKLMLIGGSGAILADETYSRVPLFLKAPANSIGERQLKFACRMAATRRVSHENP